MKVPGVLVLTVLGVLAASVAAQAAAAQPPRDARAVARGTAVISGTVVSDDFETRPVRHARVTCGSPDVPGHTTITDDRGRFVFAALPAGRYTIGASKEAWIAISYGAKRPLRPGSSIPLADGQRVDVVLRLPRGAVITGIVTDQTGQPAVGAPVRALKWSIVNGERRLMPTGIQGIADDRGTYRIYGLPPGDYAVAARIQAGPAGQGKGDELRLTTDRPVTFAATYFPGSTAQNQAGRISLRAGEERAGVDFAVQLVPTARIEGTVALPEGGVPPGTEVNLVSKDPEPVSGMPLLTLQQKTIGGDGSFVFSDVPPGQYGLFARAARQRTAPDGTPAAPEIVWAAVDIAIDGEPVSGLALTLQPGMTISGRVRFDATTLKPPDVRTVRIVALPVLEPGLVQMGNIAVSPGPDGRFTLAGITPGRYELSATFPGSGRPGGWALRSAIINGLDTLDVPMAVQPGLRPPEATITFTDHPAGLTGMLHDASGAAAPDYTLVLFPTDQSLWLPQSRRIRSVRPSADGTYTISNLPPGYYLVVAIDDVEPGEWYDPAFLQRLTPAAMKITVAEGEQKSQDIRSGGG